ncbi:MAG TPA: ATP-binding protein [Thermoanaerobaculia bacterium]|jgi:signal transduction histidine kinase|nr:ATP-binding protein [Thermoanaerobaculia bacterium]
MSETGAFATGAGPSGELTPTTGLEQSRVAGVLHVAADGTAIAANDTFLQLAGRSRQELERGALRWSTLFQGADSQTHPTGAWQAYLLHPAAERVPVLVEVLHRGASGSTALVLDWSAARMAEQALIGAREVLEERTHQLYGAHEKLTENEHALEAAARHQHVTRGDLEAEQRRVEALATRLANANRELDAFSYSVSHDLRAPLRSIDGFSRVVLSNYGEKLDDRGRDYLQRVRGASQRMARLLDDLLRLARTSRATMASVTVDLSAAAREIAADLQQTAPERQVTWQIEPDLLVRGDRTLLRVLLENLLGNAWKFTARREDAVIEVGRGADGAFFVRDNGAGFDMTYADQLFGVFQRLHTTEEFEGTGIGLATVQRIIHRHGGTVRAEGAIDRGATFHFNIPSHEPEDPPR